MVFLYATADTLLYFIFVQNEITENRTKVTEQVTFVKHISFIGWFIFLFHTKMS